ncbi:MAG: hypothetical protein B6U89_07100 [Desulfurococcales archaeon ex4484_58]|nr:MAG: hypothetical protein B6U89_07100 [Desulfurococcales archaeon ex4484_58]
MRVLNIRIILVVIVILLIIVLLGVFFYFSMDYDGDGLITLDELNRGTDPFNRDTDGDQLWDGDEVAKYGTNPLKRDTDGDGLSDLDEVTIYKTDPLKRDTDGDSLEDGTEVLSIGSNPLTYDSDNDNLTDYEEVEVYRTSPLLNDTDGDGLNDYFELMVLKTDPLKNDSDSDGLDDYVEYVELKTDPLNNDTDGDGFLDGNDLLPLGDAKILINISSWSESYYGDEDNPGDPYFIIKFYIATTEGFETYNVTLIAGYNVSEVHNLTYIFNVPDNVKYVYITIAVYDNDTVDGKTYDQLYDIVTDPEFSFKDLYIIDVKYELIVNNTLNEIVIKGDGLSDGREQYPSALDASIEVIIKTIVDEKYSVIQVY